MRRQNDASVRRAVLPILSGTIAVLVLGLTKAAVGGDLPIAATCVLIGVLLGVLYVIVMIWWTRRPGYRPERMRRLNDRMLQSWWARHLLTKSQRQQLNDLRQVDRDGHDAPDEIEQPPS